MRGVEIFKSRREFDNKFKSGIYTCCFCGRLTANPYICIRCGKQANNIFADTYKYVIEEEGEEVIKIFKPIERIEN